METWALDVFGYFIKWCLWIFIASCVVAGVAVAWAWLAEGDSE